MKISIFGLGYVGCVTAACLAQDGHTVIGVDVNPSKIEQVNSGISPINEPRLQDMLEKFTLEGKLSAHLDVCEAVLNSEISLVCVGTPSKHNGGLDFKFVEKVCQEIGKSMALKEDFHQVVIRSTVLPGTLQSRLIPILEQYSNKTAGNDFGISMNPEFLREGSAVDDYYQPGYVIIGEFNQRSGDAVEEMYRKVEAPVIRTDIRTAEMVKYVSNTFHALKVTFANEIGNLCKAHDIDGQKVMDIVCLDHRLNISATYLKPGFAFGGSCLPKDVRALTYRAKEYDIGTPLLNAIIPSNEKQIQMGINLVEKTGCHNVGILGLSFKPSTDDVRESPIITLIETLIGRGYGVSIYDELVDPSKLIGANRVYLERELPHIASHMKDSIAEVVNNSEVILISHGSSGFREVPGLLKPNQTLIDLDGIAKGSDYLVGNYEGICW